VSRKWVLIVDDDPQIRSVFTEALEQRGYSILACGDEFAAFEFVRAVLPHLIILDLRMDRAPGGIFLDYVRNADAPVLWQLPVLIVSGYLGDERGHVEGLNIVGRLEKPVPLRTLVETVENVIGAAPSH
jgi:DNA-binding response OmpR family regulator